jgi:tRNA (guanine37-N1)-methyltransferase
MNIREILEKRFKENEIKDIKGSFDIIGDVAILEIEREGVYRLRDFKLIHGEEEETEHKEHGIRIRLDVRKVYFSPREGTERQRIARQVKANETVMVMFAGAGPYAIAIAKQQPRVKKVYAIEINPDAYKYMVENVRINRLGHKVVPILGDVETECEKYFGKCDRVVMPLPKGAYEYLRLAVNCLKKSGFIHYYFWSSEDGIGEIKEIVEVDIKEEKREIKQMKIYKVSEYKPKILKFCIEMQVG